MALNKHVPHGHIISVNKGFDLEAAGLHPIMTKGGRIRAVVQHALINGTWAISVHVRCSLVGNSYNNHWHCIYREPANPPENADAVERLKTAMADMLSMANGGVAVKLMGRQS
jgi:hypothetical protein